MSTIEDVARLAGVSTATVSRVVNNNGNVTSGTGHRVLAAMQALNYYPNKFARGLAGKQADGIGVVVPDFGDSFTGMVLRVLEQVTKEHKLQMTVANGNRSAKDELSAIQFLRRQHYNVLVLITPLLTGRQLQTLSEQGMECVVFGAYKPQVAERCIYLDDVKGAEMATCYLITQGHTRIAYIGLPKIRGSKEPRLRGYRQTLIQSGLAFSSELVIEPSDFSQESAFQATKKLLERKEHFTAIFAATDVIAMGAYKALREAGLRIPDDVSVLGYDDIDLAAFFSPPLTTIKQPIQEMSMAAAQLSVRYLKGQLDCTKEVMHHFLPTLIIRQSVRSIN